MSGEPVWSGFGQHVELHLQRQQPPVWAIKTAGGELELSAEALAELRALLDEAKITAP